MCSSGLARLRLRRWTHEGLLEIVLEAEYVGISLEGPLSEANPVVPLFPSDARVGFLTLE